MLIALLFIFLISICDAQQTCEVCVKVLTDAMTKVPDAEKSKPDSLARIIREHCESSKLKDHKFCFYIGALPESATSMMADVTKPLSWSMPPEKVCEKLKAKDAQICELKYDKPLDWKTIDLKKMRVKELKNILNEWGEVEWETIVPTAFKAHMAEYTVCKGCTEKSEYVKKIEELKPKYVKEEL